MLFDIVRVKGNFVGYGLGPAEPYSHSHAHRVVKRVGAAEREGLHVDGYIMSRLVSWPAGSVRCACVDNGPARDAV